MDKKHPITGCRADTLFGIWLCPDDHLQTWLDTAWTIIEQNQLEQFANRSREMVQADEERGYVVQDGIAHVHISGPMTKHNTSFQSLFGGTSTMQVRELLGAIRQDAAVKAVFIHADSWGGTAEGTNELAKAIQKTDTVKPVVVHAEDKATSACLWVATQGRRFTCGPTASIGSLGTMMRLLDTSETVKDSKNKPVIIKAGEFKDLGAPGNPIDEKARKELQRHVNAVNEPFKAAVQAARRLSDAQTSEIASARVFVGAQACEIGLVDAVCTTDEALHHLKNTVLPEAASRGPAAGRLLLAASKRSPAMAKYTPEQLQQARSLPGATNVTEENAETVVLETAVRMSSELSDLRTKLPRIPEQPILEDRARNAVESVDILLQKERILPAQADLLKGLFQKDDKPVLNNALLLPMQDGQYPYQPFLKALELNKPSGVVQPISGAQPVTRTEPGKTEDDVTKQMNEAQQQGQSYQQQALAARGFQVAGNGQT